MIYLIEIVICGENSDSELNDLVNSILQSYKDSFNICNSNLQLISSKILPIFKSSNPIIIFKNSCKLTSPSCNIPDGSICILDPQNINAINHLSNKNITAISCGTSNKDTINIASLSFPKAVISLQRTIKNIHNKSVEPKDIILDLKAEYNTYSILSACALILLLQVKNNQRFLI